MNSPQQGFLLTRQTREINNQSLVDLWVKCDDHIAHLLIENEDAVTFILEDKRSQYEACLQKENIPFHIKPTALSTFNHDSVLGLYFKNTYQKRSATQLIEQLHLPIYESDIRLADRYLMERFICGGLSFIGNPVQKKDHIEYRNVKVKTTDRSPKFSMVSLDVECSEKGILYSVALHSELDTRIIMVGDSQDSDLSIQWVENEKTLLVALESWFYQFDPDIIIGWNVINFDFRLLIQRAKWHKLPFRIGRGNSSLYWRDSDKNRQQGFLSFPGRVVLDGIDALKTATYHFSSWSLESVAQELLKEGKSINDQSDKMSEINRMYREDKLSLAKYNLQDCVLVTRIFEHTHLLEFLIERTKLTGVELDRVGGSVAAFTNLYLPRLHRAGYIAPNLESDNWIASPGGYVMNSKPGLYQSVIVLDFKSLYPSIIRTFNIDPLGLIEGLKQEVGTEDNQAIDGFRGGRFHRSKHFLPKLIENLWSARDEAKRNNEKAFSQAIKIIMNSFYGVLGSSGCRFFDHRLASSITMRGHEIMKITRELIEAEGYEVIYGDTDSTFVTLGQSMSSKEADAIGSSLVEKINQWWISHLSEKYAIDSALEIEYETHYRTFLMPTIRGAETGSKKRYAGLVKKEGKEEIVFKGLETVRTDWTPLSQEFQKTLFHKVFHQQDVKEYVRQYVDDTKQGRLDKLLIYRKRLRRQLDEYQKNVPPHVKAARLADYRNQQIEKRPQYQYGGWIEYIITTAGPEPVEYINNPIDYDHYVEKQLKPIADGILPFIGLDFNELSNSQLGLF
ncbi:DNA polymerase II [Aliivibrio fischeri]|uniref:DNA polymerase II n=1 Tax=Aliivibrio fischeri TaxID=668 RepID=UPI0007C48387|nr:DNA polymerase II [Aliivibrio fischeri]MCE7554812.1 DNA polymerase II [Aliivibrio fischeri]MCE7562080.1 DNA polymerase II [Aliivibrio fischeri]MCE7569488.1 DNA polymerase II [Aliivibrio fischeri]